MSCPICDQKPMNCDCTETERRQFAQIEEQEAEIARLRLTDAEREALIHAMAALDHVGTDWTLQCAATLRGLMERLGGAR